jgi:hypothetical protein
VTSILSAISGQFSKSLILGTFMPVVVFVILSLYFAIPLFPVNWELLYQLQQLDTQGIIIFSFLTIVLTGVLYNLNIPIIRLYEGYPWRESFIGKWATRYYQSKLRFDIALRSHAQLLRDAPKEANERELITAPAGDESQQLQANREREIALKKIGQERIQAGQRLMSSFPRNEEAILPTRLGNVIRSFEHYPQRQYNMASITIWPRLIAKIDKGYAIASDDAKTSFDFFINCSVLSAILALMILFIGLIYPTPFAATRLLIPWIIEIISFLVLSYVSYIASIGRASAWGDMVKGAFDLYRWDLLKQLGYKAVPSTMEEERKLWGSISRQLIYGDPLKGTLPDYETAPTSAVGNPSTVKLQITRGISQVDKDGLITVNLHIKNVDPQRQTATKVVVTDTLPDNCHYVWASALMTVLPGDEGFPDIEASTPSQRVPVIGTNPYHFDVGALEPSDGVYLVYRAIQGCGNNDGIIRAKT